MSASSTGNTPRIVGPNDGPQPHLRGRAKNMPVVPGADLIIRPEEVGAVIASLELPDAMVSLVRERQAAASAKSTRNAYEKDWNRFVAWCEKNKQVSLPAAPLLVAAYLAVHSEIPGKPVNAPGDDASAAEIAAYEKAPDWFYAPSTLTRWVAAINKAHHLAGFPKPGHDAEVQQTLEGIRRDRSRTKNRAKPLLLDDLRAILDSLDLRNFPHAVTASRDAALLTMGWAGANRRSEITHLRFADVEIVAKGLLVTLRDSKTDQHHEGLTTSLPYGQDPATCPVCAFYRWVRVRAALLNPGRGRLMEVLREQTIRVHIHDEPPAELAFIPKTLPIFPPLNKTGRIGRPGEMSTQAVHKIIQRRLLALHELDETRYADWEDYSGHSLRAGFVTQALANGASLNDVANQTHHAQLDTVRGYQRFADTFTGNAVGEIGL